MTKTTTRLEYVDKIKALACVLVVLGHFLMSMNAAQIMPYNAITDWFVETIYLFHVQLFFFCSGILYILSARKKGQYHYVRFVFNKLIALGIPYFTFSSITLLMKTIAADSVNTQAGGFLDTLFLHPTAPYWYLYVLFFLFLFIPPIKSQKAAYTIFVASVVLAVLYVFIADKNITLPYFVTGVMKNAVWFVSGMLIAVCDATHSKKYYLPLGVAGLLLFILLSVLRLFYFANNLFADYVLGILAVLSLFFVFSAVELKTDKLTSFLIKYNLPVYLMHTIFAAGIRILLVKLNITAWYIHVPLGLAATFLCPALAAYVMEKTKILQFFLYPTKLIKAKRKE